MAILAPQVGELLLAVVQEWVQQTRMFTIYEVVVEARKRGEEADPVIDVPPYRHTKAQVQAIILPFVSSGQNYTRTLQAVGAPEIPFVYHPIGVDPSQYVPMKRDDAPPADVAPAADVPAADAPAVPAGAADTVAVAGSKTSEGRLNIPSHICKAAGFVSGDAVYVLDVDPAGEVPQPCAVLVKNKPDTKAVAEYKVADGRIRVTNAILQICGLNGSDFAFEGSDNKIIIRTR